MTASANAGRVGDARREVREDGLGSDDALAGPSGLRRVADRARDVVTEHPLHVVAGAALVVGLVHAVWIWQHRHVGAYDPDEAGYAATALRYRERMSVTAPLALPFEVARTGSGPLVPLLSSLLLLVGPRDPRTVLLVQPLLLGFTAVAAAGIARRLAGSGAAIVSGLALLGLPTVVSATQSYWLGLGAAAALTGAMWALVASERLTNRWAWAYGAGIAAMLLARTMALGFVPAALVAGAVVAGRDRRSWIGMAKGTGAAVLLAGPWYLIERDAIFGYLFTYGYGERAGLFGPGGLPGRADARWERLADGVGVALVSAIVVLVAAAASWAWRRRGALLPDGLARLRPSAPPPRADAERTRLVLALVALLAVGAAALMSTSNKGVWFELPLITVAVPVVVALGAAAPAVVRALAAIPVVVAAVLQLACAWWIIPPGDGSVPFVSAQGRVAHYEYGFEQYDPRFGPESRDQLQAAADDWARLSESVAAELARIDDERPVMVTFSGSFQLFNTNSVQLASELDGRTQFMTIPDTVRPPEERAGDLTPEARTDDGGEVTDEHGDPVERVLLIAEHDQHLFTPDAEVAAFAAQARAAGWEDAASFPIPGGGEAVLLRHPDAPEPG